MQRVSAVHHSLIPLTWMFFLSGFPALVYQTAWQRILVLHSGVGSMSVAAIVAAYMLGLGAGSMLGARLSKTLRPSACLLWFGAIEVLTGLCGFFSPDILYKVLYLKFGHVYGDVYTATLLHLGVLFVPTALMGATLPLMSKALVRRQESAPGSISRLYAMNTLGAAVGAMVTPWIIIPMSGVTGAIYAAAGMNIFVGLVVFLGNARARALNMNPVESNPSEKNAVVMSDEGRQEPQPTGTPVRPAVWMLVYFLSGMCAIGLEIVWFRILDVAVKSTAYTFGTMLSLYLTFMAAGSFIGARRIRAVSQPFRSFLAAQCGVVLLAALPVILLTYLPVDTPGLNWYVRYWASEEPFRPGLAEPVPSLLLYLVLPSLLMGPSTALMGFSFSLLQKGIQKDTTASGYRVGIFQAANILGCTVGSLLCGLWLLDVLGTSNTLRVMMSVGIIMAAIGLSSTTSRVRFATMIVTILLLMAFIPSNSALWVRLHGQSSPDEIRIAEDMTGVSALTPKANSQNWWIWANGKTQSLLPYGGFHTKLGVLPVTLVPDAKSIAIIGLGSGDTAWAAACRSSTERVRVFEICTPEIALLNLDFSRSKWKQVDQLLADSRINIDPRDARYVLMTDDAKYDVIEADAVRHHSAFAGYLYSVEFFQLCGRKLNPGGVMCTWSPTPTVHTTFRRAFPYVIELEQGLLLIGSNEPLSIDQNSWKAKIADCSMYLGQGITDDCSRAIEDAKPAEPSYPSEFVNTDLFPFDEFN